MLMVISSVNVSVFAASNTDQKIDNFRGYLVEKAKNDKFTANNLEKFDKLSKKEKGKFVELIYNKEIKEKAIKALTDIGIGDEVKLANGDVIVKAEYEDSFITNKKSGVQVLSTEQSGWGSYKWTMTVLGIPVTSLQTKVYYTYDGSTNKVIRSDNAINSHSNYDPLIIVTDGVSSHWKSGDYAYGNGPFTIYGTASFGFVSASVAIIVKTKPGYVTGWKESI